MNDETDRTGCWLGLLLYAVSAALVVWGVTAAVRAVWHG